MGGKRQREIGLVGKWAELHPWHPSPVLFERALYPSLEHAFAAAVAGSGPAAAALRAKLSGESPPSASQLRHLHPVQHVPAAERLAIMRGCLRDKLMRHPHIKQLLLDSEEAAIVHADDSADEFWGARGGVGTNHLGRLLEALRAEIASGKQVAMWMASTCKPFPPEAAPRVTVAVRRKGELVETRPLDSLRPFFTIGKFDSSDFVLAHPTSSRKHALLALDAGCPTGVVLVDLASKAGSTVNGAPARALEPTTVHSGAELAFGLGSSRTYTVTIDQSQILDALEHRRSRLHAEIATMESLVADEGALFGLAPGKGVDPARSSVFIGNLPFEAEEADVKELLEAYGPVKRVNFLLDKETGKPRGVCFVDFESAAHAHAACALSGEDFLGRSLRVELAAAKQPRR